MDFLELKKMNDEYVVNAYSRYDLAIKSGIGAKFIDFAGKEYLDFGSGIGVNIFGACDKEWVNDVTKQLNTLQHTSNLYYTMPSVLLAKMLCEKTQMKKVFFGNSGAEANEGAIKAARKYHLDKYEIITLENSFHGRTMATLSATGQEDFHKHYAPFLDGFKYVQPNNLEAIYSAKTDKTCAIMIEVVQGEGGVLLLDKEYCLGVQKFCQENDLLFIIDEVQSGNGRCGYLYAYMAYGLKPNIITTAKGLAGGLPMGAIIFDELTANIFGPSDHASTFGGNLISASGALSIIRRLDDNFLADVKRKGEMIKNIIQNYKNVLSVSGMGLMIGVETTKDAKEVVKKCMDKGVIFLTAKKKIRLLPPLNITDKEIIAGLKVLKEVIEE